MKRQTDLMMGLGIVLLVSGCNSICGGFWISGPDRDYLGLTPEAAGALAEQRGLQWRVVHRDGQGLGMTLDLNSNRMNFCVEDGVVFGVEREGGWDELRRLAPPKD